MAIELPKDAEGREIPLDTAMLYDEDGNAQEIIRYDYLVLQIIPSRKWNVITLDYVIHCASDMHLTPPDSWEKLEDGLDRCIEESNLCMYYNQNLDCNNCTISGNESRGCTSIALEDIKKRIRMLRGEDDE